MAYFPAMKIEPTTKITEMIKSQMRALVDVDVIVSP